MPKNFIDELVQGLTRLDANPDLALTNPKMYTKTGILLDAFAKQSKFPVSIVKKKVMENPFFKLGTAKIQKGIFKKIEKNVTTIEWTNLDELKDRFSKNPNLIIKESTSSKILMHKIITLIINSKSQVDEEPIKTEEKFDFSPLMEDRIKLYSKYFPDEFEQYQHEGKHESDLEKRYRKHVPKGSDFHFSDGKVANNLFTWMQCIQLASNDVILTHIMNDDFYVWLEQKVKVPEISRICFALKKSVLAGELKEKDIRIELLNNINKTSLNNLIFETLITPLIKNMRSDDQAKALDAIDKLINIGDSRIVEPMMQKVFDSSPQIRKKIIIGLGKLGDRRATPVIIKTLKYSTDLEDKIFAIKALSHLKDERARKILKKLSKEPDEVGREAQNALKSYGD